MGPEQRLGEEVDERADVYSLGVIALETLTGRLRIAQQFFHQTIESELLERLVVPAPTAPHPPPPPAGGRRGRGDPPPRPPLPPPPSDQPPQTRGVSRRGKG